MTDQLFTPVSEIQAREAKEREYIASTVLDFLDTDPAMKAFTSDTARQSLIDDLEPDEFSSMLVSLNAVARGLDPHGHTFDSKGVKLQQIGAMMSNPDAHIPPRDQDKSDILEYAVSSVQKTNPHDAGMALGFAVNAVHPFADGNGRTSRLVYSLFAEGYTGSVEDRERITRLLDSETGRSTIDVPFETGNAYVAEVYAAYEKYGVNLQKLPPHIDSDKVPFVGDWTPADIHGSEEISDDVRKQMASLFNENETIGRAFSVFLEKRKDTELGDFAQSSANFLQVDELMGRLSEADYKELIEITFALKKHTIELMVDQITNQDPKAAKKIGKMTLLSSFIQESRNLLATKVRPDDPFVRHPDGSMSRELRGYRKA